MIINIIPAGNTRKISTKKSGINGNTPVRIYLGIDSK